MREKRHVNNVVDILTKLGGGRAVAELGLELDALVLACQESLKGGTLTLTLKVQPVDDGQAATIQYAIASKCPKINTPKNTFWVSDTGELSRDHPGQLQLFDEGEPKVRKEATA